VAVVTARTIQSYNFLSIAASLCGLLIPRPGCDTSPSASTIRRILNAIGLITPEPRNRLRSPYRFEAAQPNECRESVFTRWRLLDGTDVEVLNWLDDHSRLSVSCTAHASVTGDDVVDTFLARQQRPRPARLLYAAWTGKTDPGRPIAPGSTMPLHLAALEFRPNMPVCETVRTACVRAPRYSALSWPPPSSSRFWLLAWFS
jgi:hypothetical protein